MKQTTSPAQFGVRRRRFDVGRTQVPKSLWDIRARLNRPRDTEVGSRSKKQRLITPMDEQLENRLLFLRNANTEGMPHSDRGLFDHLLGTRQLLMEWGARPALCDAGLFHSIYSTEHYEQTAVPLTRRDEVRQLIGEEAESLVWLFCMMRREAFFLDLGKDRNPSVQHRETGEQIPLSSTQHQDLVTLLFANSLEAFPRCSWFERRSMCTALRHYRKFAIPSVQRALERIDVQWWEIWK